jgi:hypothetical protein
LEITMTPTSILSYQGTTIRLRGAMLNLTDIWRAAGRPKDQRPADWLALEETQRFRAYAGAHWTDTEDPLALETGLAGIWHTDSDGFVAVVRGSQGGTWAHWQLALSYARHLSPAFHLWCNTVLRTGMKRLGDDASWEDDQLPPHLAKQFRQLHRRLDILDRHAADLMFLVLSSQDLLLGNRRPFSVRSQAAILRVAAAEPFVGRCPCCSHAPVLTEAGQPASGAEFDHFFHRGLNRPEHGWLVCTACHAELTHGGYLARFSRMAEFRAFQTAVLEQRRRAQPRPVHRPQ